MHPLESLASAAGVYTGVNTLFLSPTDPPRPSAAEMTVTPIARGKFVRVDYTWAYDNEPQEGSLLLGTAGSDGVRAVWVDSFHMNDQMMLCLGTGLDMRGTYPAPPGPDWGWRIGFEVDGDELRMRMFNITPEGEQALAVDAVCQRV